MRRHQVCQYSVGTMIGLVVFRTCTVSAKCPGDHEYNACIGTGSDTSVPVPFTGCEQFYTCRDGTIANRLVCNGGRLFDVSIGGCNHANLVRCVDATCDPTSDPTTSPTFSPTKSPSESPTYKPTKSPSEFPTVSPTDGVSALKIVTSKKDLIEQFVLKSYNADRTAYPSIRYTFESFYQSIQIMAVDGFGADFKFMLWEADREKYILGLLNLSAFLANVMVEAVQDDTCDELNWQQVGGRYPISNSCGQEGRSYQDETCGIYSCIVDTNMEITAVNAANTVRAPPPMECRPGSGPGSYAGFWNTNTGTENKQTPYANTAGRIDIEGCCYWGRGALRTRGSCNIGKLNYYLGSRAAKEGRNSLYPDIDFCADPEATCVSAVTDELRWTTAFFEWSERVQRYNNAGWDFEDQLTSFYYSGMNDDSFIDNVGKIVYRGCHTDECSDLEVRFPDERKANFYTIVNEVFAIGTMIIQTKKPTFMPTPTSTPDFTPQTLFSSSPTTENLSMMPSGLETFIESPVSVSVESPVSVSVDSPVSTPEPPVSEETSQPLILPFNICAGLPPGFVPVNSCRGYVQCQNGSPVTQQSCPEGLLFDSVIVQCNWADSVVCNDVSSSTPTSDFTPQPSTPSIESPVSSQTASTQNELPCNICEGLSSGYVPMNGCKEFMQCQYGRPVKKEFCAAGLLFDSAIGQCNHAVLVNACDAPLPTMIPTVAPVEFPTNFPAEEIIPLTPRPTFATPMPTESMPAMQPSNSAQSKLPTISLSLSEPTASRDELSPFGGNGDQLNPDRLPGSLVVLEGNGAEKSWSSFACVFGIAGFNLLLWHS